MATRTTAGRDKLATPKLNHWLLVLNHELGRKEEDAVPPGFENVYELAKKCNMKPENVAKLAAKAFKAGVADRLELKRMSRTGLRRVLYYRQKK